MVTETRSPEETYELGRKIGLQARPGQVYTLTGDLGVGKTVFTQGVAAGLGITEPVSSPTFTIVNEYLGERELIHFDMYRLKSSDELFDIGWEDYLDRGAVCAVEWSENVSDAFFGDELVVRIDKVSDNQRKITISEAGEC